MSAKKDFKIGDRVMAKWPDSPLWFNAVVLEKGNREVTHRGFFRRSSSRGRSPGRKSSHKTTSSKPASRSSSATRVTRRETKTGPSPKRKPRSRSKSASKTQILPVRQSTRIAEKQVSDDVTDTKINNISKYNAMSASLLPGKKISLYGCTTSLFSLLWPTVQTLPLIAMLLFLPCLLNQICTKKRCTVKEWPDFPLKLDAYYDLRAVLITLSFIFALIILYFVPLGRAVKTSSGNTVRLNGILSLILAASAVPVLMKFGIDVLLVYKLFRHILVSFLSLGVLLAILLYIKAMYAHKKSINPKGITGHFIPDFVEGREVNPAICNVDLKFLLFRCAMIAWVLIQIVIVVKDLQDSKGNFSPTLLMSCTLQMLYALDFMWFEETFLSTYEYQKQGTGLMVTAGYFGMPFIVAIYSRFILNHRHELPWYCLAGIAVLNLFGYVILRGSSSQKHAFRMNPSDPAVAHMESIPSTSGSRLLVSGWWGYVRHPNYIGDLLVQLSWTFLCGFEYAVPWIVFSFSLLYLLVRITIIEATCQEKYRSAWASYCQRVPYRLVPKIF